MDEALYNAILHKRVEIIKFLISRGASYISENDYSCYKIT